MELNRFVAEKAKAEQLAREKGIQPNRYHSFQPTGGVKLIEYYDEKTLQSVSPEYEKLVIERADKLREANERFALGRMGTMVIEEESSPRPASPSTVAPSLEPKRRYNAYVPAGAFEPIGYETYAATPIPNKPRPASPRSSTSTSTQRPRSASSRPVSPRG